MSLMSASVLLALATVATSIDVLSHHEGNKASGSTGIPQGCEDVAALFSAHDMDGDGWLRASDLLRSGWGLELIEAANLAAAAGTEEKEEVGNTAVDSEVEFAAFAREHNSSARSALRLLHRFAHRSPAEQLLQKRGVAAGDNEVEAEEEEVLDRDGFIHALRSLCVAPRDEGELAPPEQASPSTAPFAPSLPFLPSRLSYTPLCSLTQNPHCSAPFPSRSPPSPQVRINFNGQGSMFVGWTIPKDTVPRNASVVRYGTAPGNCSLLSPPAQLLTYNVGTGWVGFVYKAFLHGLLPATRYFYSVGDAETGVWSQQFSFITPSTPSRQDTDAHHTTSYSLVNAAGTNSSGPTHLVFYGDIGTAIPAGFLVTERIVNDTQEQLGDLGEKLQAVVAVGDLSYANCCTKTEIEWVWDIFGRQTQKLSSLVPYATVTGNHERQYDFAAFSTRYYNPGNVSNSGGVGNGGSNGTLHWFSFQTGLAWVTVISTEHSYAPGSPQALWLAADFKAANANRHNTPWLLVSFHFPMYASDFGVGPAFGPGSPIQVALEPLLVQAHVDLVFTGHHHVYERTYPVINGTVTGANNTKERYFAPGAPTHVMIGTGGGIYPDVWLKKPAWSVSRIWKYGYSDVTLFNSTHLRQQFRQLNLTHPSLPSDVTDEFWIVRP